MPALPNMRRSTPNPLQGRAGPVPLTLVDTPAMDYVGWLEGAGSAIAEFDDPAPFRVAVVGSGAAGLTAAYELLRCGLDVTVFEATNRVGGRLLSEPSSSGDGTFFEMGAMRFTPSERLLHHYADVFNASGAADIRFGTGAFPDPGDHRTLIAFRGRTYVHDPAAPDHDMPASAAVVANAWTSFLKSGFTSSDGAIDVAAPDAISAMLATGKADQHAIRRAWQGILDGFGTSSLYDAMRRIFMDANAPGGRGWSERDLEFFGAAGTGVGGFGPLFPASFVDILRSIVNGVESDQHELLTGVRSLVDGFLDQPVSVGGSTRRVRDVVRTECPVRGIAPRDGMLELALDGGIEAFDRVVVATSHRAMELTLGLGVSRQGAPLDEDVADALRRLQMSCSSKVFVETRDFWSEKTAHGARWPRNVVGDTITGNLYVLTYPSGPPGTGALLLSYSWAEDSLKQQAFQDPRQRLELLMRDISAISPEFAEELRRSMLPDTARFVDWQTEHWYHGAFKLSGPGQDALVRDLFFDFQKAGSERDTGVYIAGDSIGFLGAWVENALQTGLNAAAGVARSLGGRISSDATGPFALLDRNAYRYDPPIDIGHAARIPANLRDA